MQTVLSPIQTPAVSSDKYGSYGSRWEERDGELEVEFL